MIRSPDDHFGSFMYRYVCFYEKLTLVPVFTNQKKSKEDFHFYRKRQVTKTVFSVWQGAITEAAAPTAAEGPSKLPSPGPTLSISACLGASVPYLDGFCASLSKTCP